MVSLNALNPAQKKAASTIDGPVLVLSGAGTGKTRTITYRIAHMLDKGIPAKNILAVTFTNKAAREMQERVRTLVGANADAIHLSTFHSFGARVLREHAAKLGYRTSFSIYDANDQLSLVRKALRTISVSWKKFKPDDVLHAISRARTPQGDLAQPAEGDPVDFSVAQSVWKHYRAALQASNAVDFDDLLFLPLQLLREHRTVLAQYREQFTHILVDEYQDTNDLQFQLLHALAAKHRNLCVVGDDDQSIYGWRGAQIRNILDFERHFPGALVVKLEENYRSTSSILNAANAVIAKNPLRKPKTLWTRRDAGAPLRCFAAPDEVAEAELVVADICAHRRAANAPYSAYAILMRTNTQSRPLEEALRRYRVPYVVVGGMQFYDRREIKDCLGYLALLANPHDEEALLRIINVPPRNIGDATVAKLEACAEACNTDLYHALAHTADRTEFTAATRDAMAALHALFEAHCTRLATEKPSVVARSLWQAIGYEKELQTSARTDQEVADKMANVDALIESIAYYEQHAASPTLEEFLRNIALLSNDDDEELQSGRLPLMTIHASKGLEFPQVYLVGAEQNLIPHFKSVGNEAQMAEERRLMYVAITRAQREMTISYALARMKFGKLEPRAPSEFLADIPPDLIEWHTDACTKPASDDQIDAHLQALRALLAE